MTDGSGGYLLALLTDSFAVRAFIGTLAAVFLSLLAIRLTPVRSPLGRRVLVLAPVVTAAAAAVASVGGQFIPTVLVMSAAERTASGSVVDMLGESRLMTQARSIGVLLAAYVAIATLLLSRRMFGALSVRRMLHRARRPDGYDRTLRMVQRLSASLEIRTPDVRLVTDCPGGAFSSGRLRPVIALDPALVATLDDGELEGLIAHELAHLRRADPLTGLVVGVIRDVAFFLPGVHIAAHWLCMEQEESADELAAAVTHRPAALASGLLKAWQTKRRRIPHGACAASGAGTSVRLLRPLQWSAAHLMPAGLAPWPAADGMAILTRRVERLIHALPAISDRRRQVEMWVGVTVTIVAVVAALAAPAWLSRRHADLLGFFYLTTQSSSSAESPAFTTFRALSSDVETLTGPVGAYGSAGTDDLYQGHDTGSAPRVIRQEASVACPCVSSPTQLALGQSASPTEAAGSTRGSQAWTLQHLRNRADLQATRRLLLMDNTDQQFGFLTAGRPVATGDSSLPSGLLK